MKSLAIRHHHRQTMLSIGLALVILCLSALSVAAASVPALVEGVAQSGILPGNEAGSFASYVVQYPGDDAEMVLSLEVGTSDAMLTQYVGMNVYGPYDFTAHGALQDDGTFEISYCEEDAAELYVQVYNYSITTVPYSLSVEGLAVEAAEIAAEIEPVAAETRELAMMGSVSGSVVGNTGGAFANYPLTCTNTEADITISMSYLPNDPSLAPAFGFDIWDPSGEHVATGVHPSADDHGTLKATFQPEVEGEYVIQVHNYTDGALFTYTLATSY